MLFDIIVVGGGPAGLTAALYGARAGRKVLVLEKESFGGQIMYSPVVDNYPACPHHSGAELGNIMMQQVLDAGAECASAEVLDLFHAEGESFILHTDVGDYESKSVVLATGVRHRKIGLPDEERLTGNGVSYCAVCDGAFYAGRKVCVAGGGDTALKAAIFLAERCSQVVVIHRRDEFRAEKKLVELAKSRDNIEFRINKTIIALLEKDGQLRGLELEDVKDKRSEVMTTAALFVAIGQEPQSEPFSLLGLTDDSGYFDSDETTTTFIDGLFVAGDCRAKDVRQLVTAVADGAVAGLAAAEFAQK